MANEHKQQRLLIHRMIENAGGKIVSQEVSGGSHVKLTYRINGSERFKILPSTPSCPRAFYNLQAVVRRELEELTGKKF